MNKKKIRKYEEMKLDDYQVKLLPMANLYPTLILDHTLWNCVELTLLGPV